VKVTNDPLASLDVERIVTRGGAVNDVFPFESTNEMKLGLASVDSGASVIVLVVVPVKDTGESWIAGEEGARDVAWPVGLAGAGDVAWPVGLAAAAFVVGP